MLNLMSTSRPLPKILLAGASWCVLLLPSDAGAQSGSTTTSQTIMLKDPTPRPPDLQRQYAEDPVARARQQQAALAQSRLRRQQVMAMTNQLVLLAQELKDEIAKNDKGASTNPGSIKAQDIEKLVKQLKKAMKSL